MRKTFRYRLCPSRSQGQTLEQTLNTCRILYNNALAERKEAWEREKRSVSYHEQAVSLPGLKESNPFLPQVHAQVLQDALRRVDKSFRNFFHRIKKGEKAGHPRFKGKDRYDSFAYPQSGFKITGKKLWLSKIGEVNIKLHREIPAGAEIKTCTLRRDVDRWYACFSIEMPDVQAKREVRSAVGVDVGLKSLVALSTGEEIEPPKFLRRSEERLAREQRKLSHKQRGSRNRNKQRVRVAKRHRKVRLQRSDFLHKLSRQLVDGYDLIAFEDLRIKNMLGNHCLAKSITDASWYQLQALTAYKAEDAGKHVVLVEPDGTTRQCSNCGAAMRLGLADRVFECSCCGFTADRDHNAALNILKRVGLGRPESMPAGGPSLERSVNQEATQLVGW